MAENIEKQMAVPGEGTNVEIEFHNKGDKKGFMVSELLMKLLLRQMPPQQVTSEIQKMTANMPEHVKEKLNDKVNTIMQMQTIGMEDRMLGDPMLNGEMPQGFGQQVQERSAQPVLPQQGMNDMGGKPDASQGGMARPEDYM